jgi:hypothetical protein
MPMFWQRPGSKAAPEKRWYRQGVLAMRTERWLAQSASNPPLAHPADDPVYNNSSGGASAPLRLTGSRPDPFAGYASAT